jgi:hypothetical protein
MLSTRVAIPFLALAFACAGVHKNQPMTQQQADELADSMKPAKSQPRLFVGHDVNGHLVVAASHYDAMNGLAVLASDLGITTPSGDSMIFCLREMPTGTHVPHWVCRFQDTMDADREVTRNALSEARITLQQQQQAVMLMSGGNGTPTGGGPRPGQPVAR